ncbi:carboxypeptidase-like regulatory domain-containing protein [Hufsiella ginkgonis]|uniref:Carboxypeptidase regulatory-like domain-containing protein n=1 Tax=Hufsiella ginkgonis TaxID=2695274 RepID=A0A7K1Y352_9SPHI|nr:carboxypeptidase-like regulatory domain-containing protein [Hufsiella ginkgonis]MXV17671.1 hypothetical protein [Hufsiella ginkgonis]
MGWKVRCGVLLVGILFAATFRAFAQVRSSSTPGISQKIVDYNRLFPFEKLFLHTDKPYYSATDTIWFKAYLYNGFNNAFTERSGLIYVELIQNNKVVKRISVASQAGLSWGQLALDENTFGEGDYTLRAYTNWMQNFGTESFFTRHIYITNLKRSGWLIKQAHTIGDPAGKQVLNLNLRLSEVNNQGYGLKNLAWSVQDGETVFAKANVETAADGSFKASVNLSQKPGKGLNLTIEDKAAGRKATIPLIADKAQPVDLQFMPEGGHLVAGLLSRVAFKALAENGSGTEVTGKIFDSKNNEVATFKSAYKGMGVFNLVPAPGETYSAKITGKDGAIQTVVLPRVEASGINLRVVNAPESDSIRVTLTFSENLVDGKTWHLSGLVNNVPYCEAAFVAHGPRVNAMLARSIFPSGIVHFTVFNSQYQPVSERMIFVDQQDNLSVTVVPSKEIYGTRDSIALAIGVKNKSGDAVSNVSLSVSVTDDSQVKLDSMENNLVSNMLLASGLKGTIESPGYYTSGAPDAAKNLDLLLLTQGWTSYRWAEMLAPASTPLFKAEPEFVLNGTVTNLSGKPVPGNAVFAMGSGKVKMMMDTVSDAGGRFKFKNFPKIDTISFFIQARNAKGRKGNLAVKVDEFAPAAVPALTSFTTMPWYVNTTDSTVLNFVKNDIRLKRQKFSFSGNNLLEDVAITAKKGVRNSQNLNGRGEADQVIDEAQVETGKSMSLVDFMLKSVKGLYVAVGKMNLPQNRMNEEFRIGGKQVHFVVDGTAVSKFYDTISQPNFYDYLLQVFAGIKLKDVTGIEVMTSQKNVTGYDNMLSDSTLQQTLGTSAYIEISTRSGNGLFYNATPNIAFYKPVPINWPREFYSPKYKAGHVAGAAPDLRSTIFWQPQLATSKTGDAYTSFYSADRPGTYTVIVQGTNLKGLSGYKKLVIKIK